MAAEMLTPTDEVTGLPHPILPYDPSDGGDWSRVDFHHHFFPRRSHELAPMMNTATDAQPEDLCIEDLANLAVRVSRGQLLAREIHEEVHKKLLGPVLPTTVDDKFITAVKACSGFVSRWAIDIRLPGENRLVYMPDEVFARVASPRALCGERSYYDRPADYRRRILGNFFINYAIQQDLSHISAQVVDEFLYTMSQPRKVELGNLILKQALEVGIAPVVPLYPDLKRQGYIQPGKVDVRTSVKKTIQANRLTMYYPQLAQRLTAA
jgi:hypothetical protein